MWDPTTRRWEWTRYEVSAETAQKRNRRNSQGRTRDGRYRKEWKVIRQAVIDAAGGICVDCGGEATQAHRVRGGYHDSDLSRYEAVCPRCHGRKRH